MRKAYHITDLVLILLFAIYLILNAIIELPAVITIIVSAFYFILAIVRVTIIIIEQKKRKRR